MRDLHGLSGWLAAFQLDLVAGQCAPDDRMQPRLGEALAVGLGLPDVEVAQAAVRRT